MLYFIALIPPSPLKDKIQEWKQEFKEKYHSAHALNAPPHITLLSPFRLKTENKATVDELLRDLTSGYSPFDVRLKDLSTFGTRVIFITILKDKLILELQEHLENLAREHEDIFKYHYKKHPYHPHLTLAFKDLTKTNFQRAWTAMNNTRFEASFQAKALYLLKHDGKSWEIDQTYRFNQ